MTQYISKSALVAEINRRRNICKKVVLDLRTEENKDYYQGKTEAYKEALDFLDTLEVKDLQEEPVSEELESAAKAYSAYERGDDTEVGYDINRYEGFIAGSNWQKNKMTTFGWKRATEELNIGCIIWDESRHLHLYSDIVTKGQLYISMADILSLPGSPKEKEG